MLVARKPNFSQYTCSQSGAVLACSQRPFDTPNNHIITQSTTRRCHANECQNSSRQWKRERFYQERNALHTRIFVIGFCLFVDSFVFFTSAFLIQYKINYNKTGPRMYPYVPCVSRMYPYVTRGTGVVL